MCQLIVFWHTCGHLLLSSMKCPFDGAATHEEETTTTSLVDQQCWLCNQSPDHPLREKVERLQSLILTVNQLEEILAISSYDGDFLARIAGFYARGDHKRWGQPGETKARYTKTDSYITSLELEVALAARSESRFPMSPGLMFDLELALAKRFDVTNVSTLLWPLRGWRGPCPSFYSSSNMLELLSKEEKESCEVKLDMVPQFDPQAEGRQASSKPSDTSGTPPSATTLSICHASPWPTFPDPVAPSAPAFVPFCDVVADWTQMQDSNTSVSETQGPGPGIPYDNLFGFDPCPLNDAMMPGPDLSAPQMMDPVMSTPTGIMMQQSPMGPYTTIAADTGNLLYSAGTPAQPPDPTMHVSLPAELLPFSYTTPVMSRPMSSTAGTSMSPMSMSMSMSMSMPQTQGYQGTTHQTPTGHPFQHQHPSLPMTPTPNLNHCTPDRSLSSISYLPQPAHLLQLPPQPQDPRTNPPKSANLFSSHGRPSARYTTPVPSGPSVQAFETPDHASTTTQSTADMDAETESSSPSPSARRRRVGTVSGNGMACAWGHGGGGIGMGRAQQVQDQCQGQPQGAANGTMTGTAMIMTPMQNNIVPQMVSTSKNPSGSRKRKWERERHRRENA